MNIGVTCVHDWSRESSGRGGTTATLSCRHCGAASVSRTQSRGYKVTTSLDIYPPHGASVLDPELYDMFIRQWDAECASLVASGFTVNRKPATIHSKGQTTISAAQSPSRGLRARDVVFAFLLGLIGGVVMLVLGVTYDIDWLATAGGVVLALVVLIGLLVIFLSS
jgi:hypothetical protein